MANKADEYHLAIENCVVRAELSTLQEISDAWLNLRDSYALLLQAHLDEALFTCPLIGGRPDRRDVKERQS